MAESQGAAMKSEVGNDVILFMQLLCPARMLPLSDAALQECTRHARSDDCLDQKLHACVFTFC